MEIEVDEEYESLFKQILGTMTDFCSKKCDIRYANNTINLKEPRNTEVTNDSE